MSKADGFLVTFNSPLQPNRPQYFENDPRVGPHADLFKTVYTDAIVQPFCYIQEEEKETRYIFAGFQVLVDPEMPKDELRVANQDGEVIEILKLVPVKIRITIRNAYFPRSTEVYVVRDMTYHE